MIAELYTLADPDYYAPVFARADRERTLVPDRVPDGWLGERSGPWTWWTRRGREFVRPALRVYASAKADRVQQILDTFSARCFAHEVAFRHVSSRALHEILQHKGGPRIQSGIFATAYPANARAAHELLRSLHAATSDEDGPAVPSARAYRDSRVVYYGRANASSDSELRMDGTWARVTEDGLIGGTAPAPEPPPGLEPLRLVASTNTGCAYTARTAAGGTVFVRQVPLHGGPTRDGTSASDRLREWWHVLNRVQADAPGLLPAPVQHVEAHPHAFLVSEAVGGIPFARWMTGRNPIANALAEPEDWRRYHRRAGRVLAQLERDVRRLRALGYPVTRLEHRHILIDANDNVRLTGPVRGGHSAFEPVDQAVLSELALTLLTAAAPAAKHNPDSLAHIHRDLTRRGPLAPDLWRRAASCGLSPAHSGLSPAQPQLPTPEEVEADERAALVLLRERVVDGILAAATPDDPQQIFPTVPYGYETNTLNVAYGAAGVVHALRAARADIPGWITRRLRDEALARSAELPPGLYTGSAGIAWVLADQGFADEARALLDRADRHPLTRESATLAWGAAGVAMAHLALYGHTLDDLHLDRALALLRLPDTPSDLTAMLGPHDMTGLWYGRTGVALALGQVADVTGAGPLRDVGLRLLHAELDRSKATADGGLVFPRSSGNRRALYYLHCGSAGFLTTACRYLAEAPDERLAEALSGLVTTSGITHVGSVGLGQGLAGLGFALAECDRLIGRASAGAAAWTSARALFQHTRPHAGTVRFLGDPGLRHSCDLWSGAAGVLVFLAHLLEPAPGPLFTVDSLARRGGTQTSVRQPIERREHEMKGRAHVRGA